MKLNNKDFNIMGAKKYSDETLDELVNIAINQKLMTEEDIHTYANKLFDVVQIGCWENLKNEVVQCESLKGRQYESAMKVVNSIYDKVLIDNKKYATIHTTASQGENPTASQGENPIVDKQKEIERKLKAFRVANFLDIDPENYSKHEEAIKSILGKDKINTGKELLLKLNDEQMKDYAMLTSPVRKRFEKTFINEILKVRSIISLAEENAQKQEVKNKKKFNIFKQ